MPDVFISHTDADKPLVDIVHDALTGAGLSVWVDHREGLRPGDDWNEEIQKALNQCRVGLVVLSPSSAKSPDVKAEYRHILKLGKRLYVVLAAPVSETEFPFRLNTIQYVDLTCDLEPRLHTLVRTVGEGCQELPITPSALGMWSIPSSVSRLAALPMRGRDPDVVAIMQLLKSQPVGILGIGGSGKTRLAAEIGVSGNYGGVIWLSAGKQSYADEIHDLLREHILSGKDTLNYLTPLYQALSRHLVVLDRAELIPANRRSDYAHLIEALHEAGAQVLLTSRVDWDEAHLYYPYSLLPLASEAACQIVLEFAVAFKIDPDLIAPYASLIAEAAYWHPQLIEWAVRQMTMLPPDRVLAALRGSGGLAFQAQLELDRMVGGTIRQMAAVEGRYLTKILRRLAVSRGSLSYDAARNLALSRGQFAGYTEDVLMGAAASVPLIEQNIRLAVQASHPIVRMILPLLRNEPDFDTVLTRLQKWQFVMWDGKHYSVHPLVSAMLGADRKAQEAHLEYFLLKAQKLDRMRDYAKLKEDMPNLEIALARAISADNREAALILGDILVHIWESQD